MRLLLVEDDEAIAKGLSDALARAGFTVDHAEDGEKAWVMGGDEDYDVVVLDLGLPRLDGLTVLKRWRSEGRTFPIIILSARGAWLDKVEGIEGSVAKIVKLEHAWRRLDGRNDDGFQVAPFPG